MKKIKIFLSMLLVMSGLFLSNTQVSAYNEEDNQKVEEIAASMGLTKLEVDQEVDAILMENTDLDRSELIHSLYVEIVVQTKQEVVLNPLQSRSSLGSDDVSLPRQAKGRHFYTTAKSSGWNHGHAGIYWDEVQVIHAPGYKEKVRLDPIRKVSAPRGSKVATVNNYWAQVHAAQWAYNRIGFKYNASFKNMMCDTSSFNCSQLVYCAFLSQGISLSNGSDWFVSPIDLVNDSDVYKITWSR